MLQPYTHLAQILAARERERGHVPHSGNIVLIRGTGT
jgi:hypothetical protein